MLDEDQLGRFAVRRLSSVLCMTMVNLCFVCLDDFPLLVVLQNLLSFAIILGLIMYHVVAAEATKGKSD